MWYSYYSEKTTKDDIMSYPDDGRNHYSAIKNEHNTKEFLQEYAHLIYPNLDKGKYKVEGRGGTKYKADNIIFGENGNVINISDKQKNKGLSVGSCDYTNTSGPITILLKEGSESVKQIQSVLDSVIEDKKLPIHERKKLVENYRPVAAKACNSFLNSLSSDKIIDLINRYLIKPNKEMEMFITDGKSGNRYTFPFTKHPVIELIETGFIPSIDVKAGKMSGKIIFTKNNQKEDVGLRIRCHTNNGVSALLGVSNSNPNSKFVLKFQQDGVAKLLDIIGVSPIAI